MAVQVMYSNESLPSNHYKIHHPLTSSSIGLKNNFPTNSQIYNKQLSPSSKEIKNTFTSHQQQPLVISALGDIMDKEIRKIVSEVVKDRNKKQDLMFITICKIWNQIHENKQMLDNVSDINTNNNQNIIKQQQLIANLIAKHNNLISVKMDNINHNLINIINNKFNNIENILLNKCEEHQKAIKKELNGIKCDNIKKIKIIQNNQKLMVDKINIIQNEQEKMVINQHMMTNNLESVKKTLNNLKNNQTELHKHLKNQMLHNKNMKIQSNNLQKSIEKYDELMKKLNKEFNIIFDDHQNDLLSTSVAIQGVKNEIRHLKNHLINRKKNNNEKLTNNLTNTFDEKSIKTIQFNQLQNQINKIQSKLITFVDGFQSTMNNINSSKNNDCKKIFITQKIMMNNINKMEKNFSELNNLNIENMNENLNKLSQIGLNDKFDILLKSYDILNDNSIQITYINKSLELINKNIDESMLINYALNELEFKNAFKKKSMKLINILDEENKIKISKIENCYQQMINALEDRNNYLVKQIEFKNEMN